MHVYRSDSFVVFFFLILGTFSYVSLPNKSYMLPFIQGFWDGVDWILDNGTQLVYTNWAYGQPDISRPYIKLSNQGWKTTLTSSIRPIFCSYKP